MTHIWRTGPRSQGQKTSWTFLHDRRIDTTGAFCIGMHPRQNNNKHTCQLRHGSHACVPLNMYQRQESCWKGREFGHREMKNLLRSLDLLNQTHDFVRIYCSKVSRAIELKSLSEYHSDLFERRPRRPGVAAYRTAQTSALMQKRNNIKTDTSTTSNPTASPSHNHPAAHPHPSSTSPPPTSTPLHTKSPAHPAHQPPSATQPPNS